MINQMKRIKTNLRLNFQGITGKFDINKNNNKEENTINNNEKGKYSTIILI